MDRFIQQIGMVNRPWMLAEQSRMPDGGLVGYWQRGVLRREREVLGPLLGSRGLGGAFLGGGIIVLMFLGLDAGGVLGTNLMRKGGMKRPDDREGGG